MKFVVNRAKWRAGDEGENAIGKGPTSLRNSDGFMCCLGHCALQLGVKPSEILNCRMPNEVTDKNGNHKMITVLTVGVKSMSVTLVDDSSLSNKAAGINDDDSLTQAQRERKLKTLFSKFKHKLEFVGVARKQKKED